MKKWMSYTYLIPAVYSSHSLRHIKATLIYEQTRNVEAMRELPRQSTVSVTTAYLNVSKHRAFKI